MSTESGRRGVNGVVAVLAALALLGVGVMLVTPGPGPVRVEGQAMSGATRHVQGSPPASSPASASPSSLPGSGSSSSPASALPSSPASASPSDSPPVFSGFPAVFSGFPAPALPGARPASSAGAASLPGSGLIGFAAPELLGDSSGVQLQQLAQMKSMGMTTVRVDANWFVGEPAQGNFNWSALDGIMASVHQAGLTADLIIDGCPPWAAAAGASGQFAQPASPSQFGAWAAAVAARYGSVGADYFEIWNEPNNPAFWSPAPNPAAYTADLIAAYPAIKAVDPAAVVLTGGLAPQADTSNSYDIVTFFADMYADGAQGSFDAVGDHPYTFPADPGTVSQGAWAEMDQTSVSLRSLMTAHGDAAKKIWITEFGAPTGTVTDAQQATELTQAIAAAKSTSWIGAFYIYTWSDQFGGEGFGLLDSSGQPKPAYTAVTALTA